MEGYGECWEKTSTYGRCENIIAAKDTEKKRFPEEAEKERQACIQCQWQLESPAGEHLEQVRCCSDTDRTHTTMKQGFLALRSGEWDEYKNTFRNEVKVSEWAFKRIKEAFEKVATDEARKAEHRPRNHDNKHRLLATHHRASGGGKEALRCHTCALVVSVNQEKVFRAHAVPQGLCGNLIDALKLLANQQEDGDGRMQNIVKNLCEGSRRASRRG